MRFFSNDSPHDVDDKLTDGRPDDRETRDPDETMPVPQQRAGSPWQHDSDPLTASSPQTRADETSTGTGTAEPESGPDLGTGSSDTGRIDTDGHDAGRIDTDRQEAGRIEDDQSNADDRESGWNGATVEDRGTVDDPHTGEPGHRDATIGSPAGEDVSTQDDPLLADDPAGPATGSSGAGSAVATMPSTPAALFPAADTQPLRDRWRDVQLRFVDDPKGATGEAAGLVDEAVDKLSTALRDQRGALAKGSDDTEQLRVEFRSYRDILDRLLGL